MECGNLNPQILTPKALGIIDHNGYEGCTSTSACRAKHPVKIPKLTLQDQAA